MSKYFGDKKFYKMLFTLTLPILVQDAITNFVSMLDNIMVGKVGTYEMSGVSIANQLIFVFTLCIFGSVSGAGIYGAQFYGDGNHKGVRYTFRFRLIVCITFAIIAIGIFKLLDTQLIMLYLTGTPEAVNATLGFGTSYLNVMLIGLIPFAISQSYASTLRETGETFIPMLSGVIAVGVNMFFNYVLIFGKFGAPRLGVVGAAIATVISRFVEMIIIIVWTHTHSEKYKFIKGAYRGFSVPWSLIRSITVKGTPLVLNESLWAAGMAMLTRCYSMRGIEVVAAFNINSTIANVFSIVYLSMGSAISIRIGQLLGAGQMEKAQEEDVKLTVFSITISTVFGLMMTGTSFVFPLLYNTTDEIRGIASSLIIITACYMPVQAYLNSAYFTIRSGGKTIITFLFDSAFTWCVSVVGAFLLAKYSSLSILWVYALVQGLDIIKCTVGFLLVRSGMWLQNIVNDTIVKEG